MEVVTFPADWPGQDFRVEISINKLSHQNLCNAILFLIQADLGFFFAFITLYSFLIRFPNEIKEDTMNKIKQPRAGVVRVAYEKMQLSPCLKSIEYRHLNDLIHDKG